MTLNIINETYILNLLDKKKKINRKLKTKNI